MAKRKVTFSIEGDLVESLKMMSTLTSQEQSSIVSQSLEDYFQKLGAQSGKSTEEFVAFMKEAKGFAEALRPSTSDAPPPHSQIPRGEGTEGLSALPGDDE